MTRGRKPSAETQQLLQYKSVQNWLEGLDNEYKRQILNYFIKYVQHIGLNPDQMLTQRKEDLKSDDPEQQRRFERDAKTFYNTVLEQCKKEGLGTGHAYNHLKAILSFFSRNYVGLKYKRKEITLPRYRLKRTGLTIEKLKEAYTILDVRERAIFTTMLQTGLSPVDTCALDIEPIINDLDNPPCYIEGYREKTETGYQVCVGEDAAIAIKKYLILRENPTQGALFITRTGERLTPRFLSDALEPVKKVIPDFKPKMLRDTFHDALERADIKPDVLDRMFGHEVQGARAHYEISEHTIKENYAKAYPFLTINGLTRQTAKDKTLQWLIVKLAEIVASDNPRVAAAQLVNEIKTRTGETPKTEEERKQEMLQKAETIYPQEGQEKFRNILRKGATIEEIETEYPELTTTHKELPKAVKKLIESA